MMYFQRLDSAPHNLLESYTSAFRGVTPTSLFALPDDPHPGREVHKFYANELLKVLKHETEKRGKSLGR
jgi:phospholipase/lecithinase/hemolysin